MFRSPLHLLVICTLLLTATAKSAPPQLPIDDPQAVPPVRLAVQQVDAPKQEQLLQITLLIAEDIEVHTHEPHELFQNLRIEIQDEQKKVLPSSIEYPPGRRVPFELGEDYSVFSGTTKIRATIKADQKEARHVTVRYQGYSTRGY